MLLQATTPPESLPAFFGIAIAILGYPYWISIYNILFRRKNNTI
jgi:hypothetical protein